MEEGDYIRSPTTTLQLWDIRSGPTGFTAEDPGPDTYRNERIRGDKDLGRKSYGCLGGRETGGESLNSGVIRKDMKTTRKQLRCMGKTERQ